MTNLKIICAVTNDLLNDRRMYRICTTLTEAGYDVTLVGRLKKDSKQIPTASFKTVRLQLHYESGPRFYYEYNKALEKYLTTEKPDVVYAVDTDTILGCGKTVARLGCKFVFDAHEYFTEVPELEGKWLKKLIWRFIESRYIPKTHARITVGEELAKIFKKRHALDFNVVRNVPNHGGNIESKNKRKILLYQGVLNKGRGVAEAINSLQYMDDKSVELHVVGGGDLMSPLMELARTKPYHNRVFFHGWQVGAQLESFAKQAWLGLNLLESRSLNYKYSLANKFFDYMHGGLPSINMQLPEYKNIISQYPVGLMLDELSPQALADAVNSLTDEKYIEMVDASQQAKGIYNWENDSKVLLSTISQLI